MEVRVLVVVGAGKPAAVPGSFERDRTQKTRGNTMRAQQTQGASIHYYSYSIVLLHAAA